MFEVVDVKKRVTNQGCGQTAGLMSEGATFKIKKTSVLSTSGHLKYVEGS